MQQWAMAGRSDPIRLFVRLLRTARKGAAEDESDAMTLSTVGPRGRPRARVVLLRGVDERGFTFFTNLRSAKGLEIRKANRVALCLHWPRLKVQIRIEGAAHLVSDHEANAYFAQRPRESQLAAWASNQSRALPSRQALLARFRQATKRFEGKPVPRPPHWSGFRVEPDAIEFWHGRPHRLHDRQLYTRNGTGWRRTILSP
jgi:pyridoxamine 5'-phosphate oxidase